MVSIVWEWSINSLGNKISVAIPFTISAALVYRVEK